MKLVHLIPYRFKSIYNECHNISMGDGHYKDMPPGPRFIIKMRWAREFPAFIRYRNSIAEAIGAPWNAIQRVRFIR